MSKSGEETCGLQFPTVSQVIAKWQLLVHGACRMCPLHLAESPGMMLDITYSFFFVVEKAEVDWCSCISGRVIQKPFFVKEVFSETGAIHLKIAIAVPLVHHVFMTVCLRNSIHLHHCSVRVIKHFQDRFRELEGKGGRAVVFLVTCSTNWTQNECILSCFTAYMLVKVARIQ